MDKLIPRVGRLQPVEIKSGITFSADPISSIRKLSALLGEEALPPWVIFGGEAEYQREGYGVLCWKKLAEGD